MLEVKTYDAPELLGELLLFEISPDYCRDAVTLGASSAALKMGTVLVRNADGTFAPWEVTDTDAAGVLLADVAASSSSMTAPVLRRGALVSASSLKWPADTAEDKKGVALAALEALGIIAR